MRIPTFWARAARDGFEAPGWSFTSLDEARSVAEERLGLLIEVLREGREPEGRYLYGDRPVREPIEQTLGADALVTRNSYGALCLNTNDVAFVDVDAGDARSADRALAQVRRAADAHPGWSLRVYRTAAGFRVVALHARMAPTSAEATALFDALGADPMYRQLCGMQDSFRARLTPKPWRIGLRRLPVAFPWRDDDAEQTMRRWVRDYDTKRRGFAVCELVETRGQAATDPVIQRVLEHHDAAVLHASRPLA